jgi:hypothetical protein
MTKKLQDSQVTAALRKKGESEMVMELLDAGKIRRDPATLTSAAAAANDLGLHRKAERLNKEAYAKSGGKPSEHQKKSYFRTKREQRK